MVSFISTIRLIKEDSDNNYELDNVVKKRIFLGINHSKLLVPFHSKSLKSPSLWIGFQKNPSYWILTLIYIY